MSEQLKLIIVAIIINGNQGYGSNWVQKFGFSSSCYQKRKDLS